jgi:hypothetical protein
MERGLEQYIVIVIVMLVALADLLRGWLKRRMGKGDPAELEAPSEFEAPMEFDVPMEFEAPPEPVIVLRPAPPVHVPRASSISPRGRSLGQGGQRGAQPVARQPTARVIKRAVSPLIGSRADLRRAIVLREVLGPPRGLE